jgi:hypothetical protein
MKLSQNKVLVGLSLGVIGLLLLWPKSAKSSAAATPAAPPAPPVPPASPTIIDSSQWGSNVGFSSVYPASQQYSVVLQGTGGMNGPKVGDTLLLSAPDSSGFALLGCDQPDLIAFDKMPQPPLASGAATVVCTRPGVVTFFTRSVAGILGSKTVQIS